MSVAEYDKAWLVVDRPKKPPQPSDKIPDIAIQEPLPEPSSSNKSVDGDRPGEDVAQPDASVSNAVPSADDAPHDGNAEVEEVLQDETIVKIMDITQMETRSGSTIVTKTRRFRKPKSKKDRFRDYAAILRRSLDEQGILMSVKLEIKSPFLKNAMKEILKSHQRLSLEADTIIISQPYESLFHSRDAITEYRDKLTDDNEREQMNLIVEFIETNLEEVRQEYDRNVPHGKITGAIAWTLFPPGEVLVMNADSPTPAQCFVVNDCQNLGKVLSIGCSCFEWNGSNFGKVSRVINMVLPRLSGSFPVSNLLCYPLRLHPQYEKLKTRLIERGYRYVKLVKRAHMRYNGTALTKDPLDMDVVQVHINERVMIDYAEFVRHNPNSAIQLETEPGIDIAEAEEYEKCWCSDPDCKKGGKKKPTADDDAVSARAGASDDPEGHGMAVTEDQALLCPPSVRGFALADKCWADFRIDNLEEIKWNDQAYDRLEMDDEYKRVIKALVDAHRKHSKPDSEEFDDIIAGKGLGLVMLLQGQPGLGKTLTAESVAEQAKKPLYAVTSGDLGTTVNDMESALKKAFRIAKTWNAILLLDEADVFMSKRSIDNLEKNAFVSVFLRLMEYYQGILFLTTNRAEDFDPAFMSRIHLILNYKPLSSARRANIWKNLSAKMKKDDTLNDEAFEGLAREYDINGREIKNLLRTAWCLAKDNQRPLTLQDLRTVATISSRFTAVRELS